MVSYVWQKTIPNTSLENFNYILTGHHRVFRGKQKIVLVVMGIDISAIQGIKTVYKEITKKKEYKRLFHVLKCDYFKHMITMEGSSFLCKNTDTFEDLLIKEPDTLYYFLTKEGGYFA